MYDAPFSPLAAVGWLLAGLTGVLYAVRAARLELLPGTRGRGARAAGRTLDAVAVLATAALLGVLAAVVVGGLR